MNLKHAIKGPASRAAARWAVALVTLASVALVAAQEPGDGQTNELTDAEVLARLGELIQAVGSGQPENMPSPSISTQPSDQSSKGGPSDRTSHSDSPRPPQTNSSLQSSSQSSGDERRSRSRRSSKSGSDRSRSSGATSEYSQASDRYRSAPASGTNAGPASLDYSAFNIIVERNIFDPNRYPRQARPPTRPPSRVDSLTLVGTMSYEKGDFAFFDGTSADYKKALKLTDLIAGYKLAAIAPTGVTLASGTNEVRLNVGMQLRREENGPWQVSGQRTSYLAASISSSHSTNAVAGGSQSPPADAADSDVIKRLMQRRQQE